MGLLPVAPCPCFRSHPLFSAWAELHDLAKLFDEDAEEPSTQLAERIQADVEAIVGSLPACANSDAGGGEAGLRRVWTH